MIGVSRDTVASWESGRTPIPSEAAEHIQYHTAVDPNSLLEGDGVLRVSPDWRPWNPLDTDDKKAYKRQDFRDCGVSLGKDQKLVALEMAEYLVFRVVMCYTAACRAEDYRKLEGIVSAVSDDLNKRIDGVEKRFNLKPHLARIADDQSWYDDAPEWLVELTEHIIPNLTTI